MAARTKAAAADVRCQVILMRKWTAAVLQGGEAGGGDGAAPVRGDDSIDVILLDRHASAMLQ